MKVTVREKPLSKGRKRLFLDIYPPIPNPETGKITRTHYLELYIYKKPKDEIERNHNKESMLMARAIASERELDLQAGRYNFLRKKQSNIDFVKYFSNLTDKRKEKKINYDAWKSTYNYINKFTRGSFPMNNLSPNFCNEFKDFLLTTKTIRSSKVKLSKNAASTYFNKFKASIYQAYRDGLINEDIASKVEFIKYEETIREYLTIEELQKLADTECDIPLLKKISLFSALTGLRFSDIQNLKGKDVQYTATEGYSLKFIQRKTKGVEKLPIPEQAYTLLDNAASPEEPLFPNLKYSAWNNVKLQLWIMKAGINKKITFHCFRHTYATLQISAGTDFYTVSKMLGHRNIRTTQIYAKVMDQKKIDAVNRIKLLNI